MSTPVVTVPAADEPVLSICTVLYGGGRLALQALDAVTRHTTVPYEVIVVDNCSPDGSGVLLRAGVRGVRFVANRHNAGFGGGMNQAAALARAPHLVLLNPDTEVTAGWAEPLVARAARPHVGAVTAVLLESDGTTVQEAGAVVDRTGFTFPIGSAPNGPMGPDAHFARVVDYASAAALLVRSDAFERVGGFDPMFLPAYFEDVDLGFALAEAGLRTWVEPASRVVHHKGGTDTGGAASALLARNHPRFVGKWADEIGARPGRHDGAAAELALRDWKADVRVLLLADDAAPDAALTAAAAWRAAAPDGLVAVVSAHPRPVGAVGAEWLAVPDAGRRARVADERVSWADVVLPIDSNADPVVTVAAARTTAARAAGRYRWVS
jgi:GT2 family glycosyltransferase